LEALAELEDKGTKFQMSFGFVMAIPMNDLTVEEASTYARKFDQALALLDADLAVEPYWTIAEDSKVNRELGEKLHAKNEARKALEKSATAAKDVLTAGLKQGV